MLDDDRLAVVRAAMPATRACAYLNTGTCGPIPEPAHAAMQMAARQEFEEGRISRLSGTRRAEAREAARQHVAGLVGADPSAIGLTHHTGEGLNVVLAGMAWSNGDEVVTTDVEHSSLLLPLQLLGHRYGVETRVATTGDCHVVETISRCLTDRTRLVALSHVSYATGAVFPLAEITALAHRHDVPVLVDGAQSTGAIPLDLPALGVDFYAMPGQKWLCGPDGTGALYVKAGQCDRLAQTFVGYLSMHHDGEGATPRPYDGPRRFEVGSQGLPDLVGQAESVRWLREVVGLEWIYARTAKLGAMLRDLLMGQGGVTVITPAGAAGLVCFTVDGVEPATVVQVLAEQRIIIRSIARPACCRVSTSFFNTEQEVELVARLVGAMAR